MLFQNIKIYITLARSAKKYHNFRSKKGDIIINRSDDTVWESKTNQ